MTPDERQRKLDDLRSRRMRDMLALIDAGQLPAASDMPGYRVAAARELEWLKPVALIEDRVTRSTIAPHAHRGVASPFSRSMLVVIYTARYLLRSSGSASQRSVFTVYGALEATLLPVSRDTPL